MTVLSECPTCHEHIPCVWHGHHAVSSGHPEDGEPWCKHCGQLFSELDGNNPDHYCRKVPTMPHVTDSDNMPDEARYDDPALALDEQRSVLFVGDLADLPDPDNLTDGWPKVIDMSDEGEDVDELGAIASSKQMVRDTYDLIVLALDRRRAQRDELEETIAELVEAEALWKPIVNRIENGPARRKRTIEQT